MKPFLLILIIDDIARIETAYFHHDLPCSPIDGAGRSGIILLLGDIEVDYVAIGFVDGDTMKFCMCRQRVVIVFEDAIGDGPRVFITLTILQTVKEPEPVGCTVTAVLSSRFTQS